MFVRGNREAGGLTQSIVFNPSLKIAKGVLSIAFIGLPCPTKRTGIRLIALGSPKIPLGLEGNAKTKAPMAAFVIESRQVSWVLQILSTSGLDFPAPPPSDGAGSIITTRPFERYILCVSPQDRRRTYCFQNSSWHALQEAPTLPNWALMASISPVAAIFCSSLASLI